MSEPKAKVMWVVYDNGAVLPWTLERTRQASITRWRGNNVCWDLHWDVEQRKGRVRCVKVNIVPEALMQELLTVLQSCERALLTTWGSEDDIDVPVCREITFDVSKVLMKCNKPSVLDPKTLGPVQ